MRKTLRYFVLLGCIASSAVLGGQLAFADDPAPTAAPAPGDFQGHFGGHGRHRGHGFWKMIKALKLSDQQKAQAKALFRANREAARPLFVNLVTAKHQLKSLVASGDAAPAAIQAKASALASAETSLALQRAQNIRQFLALLTPDQLAIYNAYQAKKESRFQKFISRIDDSASE